MESVAGVFVPAEVLAREQETTAEDIVEKIQNGELVGRKQSNGWHVLVRIPEGTQQPQAAPPSQQLAPAAAATPAPAAISGPITINGVTEVVVRDVQVRFSAMVVLLLKLVLALIPVGLIFGAVALLLNWLYARFGAELKSLMQLAIEYITSLIT
jgi:hypothetical protein